MIRLLQMLFWGHAHKWKIIKEGKLRHEQHGYSSAPIVSTGTRYVLQCETCGKLHQKDVV